MLLKLTYSHKSDKFKTVTVLGDPKGIRDLYWQLTHNYKAQDGNEIGKITVTNLEGMPIAEKILNSEPYAYATDLSTQL